MLKEGALHCKDRADSTNVLPVLAWILISYLVECSIMHRKQTISLAHNTSQFWAWEIVRFLNFHQKCPLRNFSHRPDRLFHYTLYLFRRLLYACPLELDSMKLRYYASSLVCFVFLFFVAYRLLYSHFMPKLSIVQRPNYILPVRHLVLHKINK